MTEGKALVKNETGLHARPASQLVKLCRTFESSIKISNAEGVVCDGKSLFSVLKGCFTKGTEAWISAEGSDEEAALQQILAYIDALEE